MRVRIRGMLGGGVLLRHRNVERSLFVDLNVPIAEQSDDKETASNYHFQRSPRPTCDRPSSATQ